MALTGKGMAHPGRQDGPKSLYGVRGYCESEKFMGEGEGERAVAGKFVWKLSAQPNYVIYFLFINRRFSESASAVPAYLKNIFTNISSAVALQSLLSPWERTHWLLDRPTTVAVAGSRHVACPPSPCLCCASVSSNKTESFAAQGCEEASPTLRAFRGHPTA
jgi:hypothetical protein